MSFFPVPQNPGGGGGGGLSAQYIKTNFETDYIVAKNYCLALQASKLVSAFADKLNLTHCKVNPTHYSLISIICDENYTFPIRKNTDYNIILEFNWLLFWNTVNLCITATL